MSVQRSGFFKAINETLFFTPNKVIVARTSGGPGALFGALGVALQELERLKKEKKYLELSSEEILKSDKNNFEISNSAISKIELKKFGKGAKIHITTDKKKHKWYVRPMKNKLFGTAASEIDDNAKMLQPIFGDILSVKR